MTDVLEEMLAVPSDKLASEYFESLWYPCNYHGHDTDEETDQCGDQQIADQAFHLMFLRACLSDMFTIE